MRNAIAYKFPLLCDDVGKIKSIYDTAHNEFIYNSNPVKFGEFLI